MTAMAMEPGRSFGAHGREGWVPLPGAVAQLGGESYPGCAPTETQHAAPPAQDRQATASCIHTVIPSSLGIPSCRPRLRPGPALTFFGPRAEPKIRAYLILIAVVEAKRWTVGYWEVTK